MEWSTDVCYSLDESQRHSAFVKEAMDDSSSFWKRVNENNRKHQGCYGQRIVVGDWIVYKGTEKIFEC